MEKILVSACLLGEKVRYDGRGKLLRQTLWQQWRDEGRLVPVCPEVSGGLPVPRAAAEIQAVGIENTRNQGSGFAVLSGDAKIRTEDGRDLTAQFLRGAETALTLAKSHKVRLAILTEGSPSCGSQHVHDGSFSEGMLEGEGMTTALLRANGIKVFSHRQLDQAAEYLESL